MSFVSKDGSEYYSENACHTPVLTTTATSEQLRDSANTTKDKSSNDTNNNSNNDNDKSILPTPLASIKREQQSVNDSKQKQEPEEVATHTTKPTVNNHWQDINEVKRTDAVKSTEETKLFKLQGMKQILTQKRNQALNTNTKIIDDTLESEEMKKLLTVLKSLSFIIPMQESDKNFLEELSLESMQNHMDLIRKSLNDLRIQQSERSAKENTQVHKQHQILRQLKDKHQQLHYELTKLQAKNNQASRVTEEMLSELKKYHHQTFHYTKLKNKDIQMLIERRDQLKVELAYRRCNFDQLTIPADDNDMLDAQAVEDVIYGLPASSIDTMFVEVDEEDEKYLLTTTKEDVRCETIDELSLQPTSCPNNDSDHDRTTVVKSSKKKRTKVESTSFINNEKDEDNDDDDNDDDNDDDAASTWIEQQLETIMSGENGRLNLQKPLMQSNETVIQKSIMTLKKMLNFN